ncbi:MAG: UDP-N-acetylmuramoyl-L-alanyl-D-glutamate--2,6-diaminopimelate ligase [Candidatus Omnitrophica bacterium]|nr:UDP-N-acetylmuramoyl-L-alanyl-D-glutamate--2,6-diaminopimelate ligase [Candidatus Omnitrophota bacterium]
MQAFQALKILGKNREDYQFADFALRGLSLDSRTVALDYCFVAINGANRDGSGFIQAAIDKGARLIVYEQDNKPVKLKAADRVVFVEVDNARISAGKLAAEYFHNPGAKLNSIGITGTNGKTTISYLIEHILRTNGLNSGIIGTIQYKISDHIVPAINTTPDAIKLQHLLRQMVEHNLSHNIMEVSSHALDQHRVEGIKFKTAVFTNLTHDHLDYHKTREEYFAAKATLFSGLSIDSTAIINSDDPYAEKLKQLTKAKVISYAVNDKTAEIRAKDIVLDLTKTSFTLVWDKTEYLIQTNLIGRYNVYNLLAAIGAAMAEGISISQIKASLKTIEQVRGRLERIKHDQGFEVFIDYAHTDDALRNVLSTLRELKPNQLITVFGCGGDRDQKKRGLMGNIASRLSDFVILTNDNPRSEDPLRIIEQIKSGFLEQFKAYEIIPQRDKAIQRACGLAGQRDFVLIAGKGHETNQVFKDKTIEFDDKKIALKFLTENGQ